MVMVVCVIAGSLVKFLLKVAGKCIYFNWITKITAALSGKTIAGQCVRDLTGRAAQF